jgi:hypothetical protein
MYPSEVAAMGLAEQTTGTGRAGESEPVWKLSRDGWQARQGVHRPFIAEISPMQYAHLSKRGKSEYSAKRAREWDASDACGRAYAAACVEAVDANPAVLLDPELHPDARAAIRTERLRRSEAEALARFEALHSKNAIEPGKVQVGDRVWWLLGSRYLKVTKVSKASVRGLDEKGEDHKAAIRACLWLRYDDLKAQAVGA